MSKIVMQGDLIYICGQVRSGDDIKSQTDDMFAESGSHTSRILSAIIWISIVEIIITAANA